MERNVFARFARMMLAMLLLPSACKADQVVRIEGETGLDKLDLSSRNKMVVVEMVKEGW